jgi:hypothetical protein
VRLRIIKHVPFIEEEKTGNLSYIVKLEHRFIMLIPKLFEQLFLGVYVLNIICCAVD